MKQFGQLKNGMGLKEIIVNLIILLALEYGQGEQPADRILGKWISAQGNVVVEIFKEKNVFKGRVLWFSDTDVKSDPMNTRIDRHNPDRALRNRTIIGLIVLKDLAYDANYNRWEHGKIYDAQSGREWDSSVWMTKEGFLKVKGFWHFELFGKTMTFKRA